MVKFIIHLKGKAGVPKWKPFLFKTLKIVKDC